MCRVHLCSSTSLLKEHNYNKIHSSSCRPPSRSLHSIFQVHQDHHQSIINTSSHAAKNWMRRTCTSSTSNRKNYLTSISTGTRSSCLRVEVVGTSASKRPRTPGRMEACWLHNQCSASRWAPRRANSRSWTSQSSRRRTKSGNLNRNRITSTFLSKKESLRMCQSIPELVTAILKTKFHRHLARKPCLSNKWAHPSALASKMPRPNHRCSWRTDWPASRQTKTKPPMSVVTMSSTAGVQETDLALQLLQALTRSSSK